MLTAYDLLAKARIELCQDVLSTSKPTMFTDKPGQYYLKLDDNAYFPYAHGLQTLMGREACIAALEELCSKKHIKKEEGFRISTKEGFVELYPKLQKILIPNDIVQSNHPSSGKRRNQ